MTADTWRRSEAEARQVESESTIECQMCRATVLASESWECPDCGQHYCPTCKPLVVTVCWECFDREDAFDEVAEIEAEETEDPGYLEMLTGVSKASLKASLDKITIRNEIMARRLDEERGK